MASNDITAMTEEEYVQERVLDQLKWLSNRASKNKKNLYTAEISVIILSAAIPVLTLYSELQYMPLAIALAGAAIAIISGVISLKKYRDTWITYRSTAEAIKQELHLYQTKTVHYRNPNSRFETLVTRIESILGQDVMYWEINQFTDGKT